MLRHLFAVRVEQDRVLSLAKALFAAVGDLASFAQPKDTQATSGFHRYTIDTWVDGRRKVVMDYRIYDDEDGKGGGASEATLSIEGFADGTKLRLRGLAWLDYLEVETDGGCGARLLEAAIDWTYAQYKTLHVLHPSLPSRWALLAPTMTLRGQLTEGIVSHRAIVGQVGAVHYAAVILGAQVLHLGPVPAATPGRTFTAFGTAPLSSITPALLYELATARPLLAPREHHEVRAAEGHPSRLFSLGTESEQTSERWVTDGWVLRSAATASGVELALQREEGEPLAVFVTEYGSSERSVSYNVHGRSEVVKPVCERVQAWLKANGWTLR